MKKAILAAMAVVSLAASAAAPRLKPDNIDRVIAAMTLEEKVDLIVGSLRDSNTNEPVIGFSNKLVPGAAGSTVSVGRLRIPAVALADGPAGLRINPTRPGDDRTYYCTQFPVGTLLAATWDTGLIRQVGQAIGNEALEYGADVLLAPGANIHRNQLCGRNFEYYSEDPLLAGKIAAAYIAGIQDCGVGTSIKHFAANNQETNRENTDAHISERALREIYLRPFEIAVKESDPWTVMTSFNKINGTYASESSDLLQGILRDEWGYTGTVMTDWNGGRSPLAQMVAGNDMLLPGAQWQYDTIISAVRDGSLPISVIDRNVARILSLIVKTPRYKGYKHSNSPELQAHAATTRRSAAEGMVLLSNKGNVLPLSPDTTGIALFGCTSYDFIGGGTGSGSVNSAYTVSLIDGLRGAGYSIDTIVRDFYDRTVFPLNAERGYQRTTGFTNLSPQERPYEFVATDQAFYIDAAARNDAAIVTIGRISGEFADRTASDFAIKPDEQRLLNAVYPAFASRGKPVIVVLNVGGALDVATLDGFADAILCVWQPGQEGGNSVADVLSGRLSPSGRLPLTFPRAITDAASTVNFPTEYTLQRPLIGHTTAPDGTNLWDYTNYEEDIFVGYRYFDSFGVDVAYPFGFGLSYTTFDYGTPALTNDGTTVTVTIPVTNTGSRPGREVVQLYATAPDARTANKPEHELRAFAKTAELQPGETQTVTLTFPVADLASYSADESAWIVDPGQYTYSIGSSSRDIRATLTDTVAASRRPTGRRLAPATPIATLRR